jgi:Zn-dependent M28 family amino/carboxypeptidase
MLRSIALLALTACAVPAAAQTAPPPAELTPAEKNARINAALPEDQAALKSHVMFLASDQLRGREAGSPEFDIAAQYVAAQFYAAGLRPAGDDGSFLQKVPLLSVKLDGKGSFSLIRKGAAPAALEFGKDFVPSANAAAPLTEISAPVVFVGYGITAPALGRDDYKGANVQGKVVAFFGGAPKAFPGEERAHFSSAATKAMIAADHGAIGYITLESPIPGNASFARSVAAIDRPRFTWAHADGTGQVATPQTPGLGSLSTEGSARLFEGAKTPWAKIAEAAKVDSAKFKPQLLPVTLSVSYKTVNTPVPSFNIAGIIKGSDPVLASEVVILSAHLDHIGVGKPDAKGDTINNGALDDAVGIASLIEEAKRFKGAATPPRRSVLFLAVTAEEKGLVGSDYYAHNPTVPKESIVADVNLDMPIINYKFEDIVVYGAEHSTLGPIVARAGSAIGVKLSADPLPDEGIFVRSDHYRFVQQGIPSVFLWPGAGGPGEAAIHAFMKNHYHKPSDDLTQDPAIDWESGVRFVDVNYRIAREIADGDQRPAWNKGDFFGLLYKGYGAK